MSHGLNSGLLALSVSSVRLSSTLLPPFQVNAQPFTILKHNVGLTVSIGISGNLMTNAEATSYPGQSLDAGCEKVRGSGLFFLHEARASLVTFSVLQ